MQKRYYVDRIHKKILYLDQEFQHHGVEGQKWGVITRNVGVNYIPVGNRTITNGYTAKDVQKYFDSIPKGDVEYGLKHKNYKETIYRDMAPGRKGFIEMYKSHEDPKLASIAVSVHPSYRNKGYASKLLEKAKLNMNDLNIDRLEYYVKKSNLPSVALAQKCGFKVDNNFSTEDWYTLFYGREY